MRGIRLKPMGRYRATCTRCQQQLALTWNQKTAAHEERISHACRPFDGSPRIVGQPPGTDIDDANQPIAAEPTGRIIPLT